MRCREFNTRLQQALDARQEPSDDALLQKHALDCAACRELLELQAALLDALTLHPSVDVRDPTSFAERVLLAVEPPGVVPASAKRSQRRLIGAACCAAVLLLIGLPMLVQHYLAPSVSEPPLVALPSSQPPVGVDVRAAAEPPNVQLAPDSGRFDNLQLRNLWERINPRAAEPVDRLAGGLRPLANSFHVAIDALRRTWPDGRDGSAVQPQA